MQLNDVFSTDGLLKKKFPTYQIREGQVQMASLVQKAIQERLSAVIEGSTGVGKGFAYLIPSIIENERIIVSTSNKSLQDQLNHKDLPTLQEVFGRPISWAVLKGKNNYFCHSHFQTNLDDIRTELTRVKSFNQSEDFNFNDADNIIQDITEWAEKEETGDLEYLPFELPSKVREMIACDNQTTHEKDSDDAKFCFASKARSKASEAQIVLVNHTLLALDISLRKESDGHASILPDTKVVIIDEAHEFEKQAVLAFSDEISMNSLYHLLNWSIVKKSVAPDHRQALIDALGRVLTSYLPEKGEIYYKQLKVAKFEGLEGLVTGIGSLISKIKSKNDTSNSKIKEIIKEAQNLQERLSAIAEEDDNMLRWSEAKEYNRRPLVKLRSVPLDISDLLRYGLFKERTVICTSATLAVNKSFEFFKQQVGMDTNTLELVVESPFDYKKQALVYITDGANDKEWEVQELIRMSKGRAFILFTSYKDLDYAYNNIPIDYPKIKQGQDGMTRSQVLKLWKETPNAVLFATKSFWEGVDIVGDKLSLVVIWKIPFENPHDLVFSSKCEKLDKKLDRKGISFIKLAVPDACIKLKQGAGRLIRSVEDTGVIALMDPRVNYANYKDMVINSLPPAYRTQQLPKVEKFFERINNR